MPVIYICFNYVNTYWGKPNDPNNFDWPIAIWKGRFCLWKCSLFVCCKTVFVPSPAVPCYPCPTSDFQRIPIYTKLWRKKLRHDLIFRWLLAGCLIVHCANSFPHLVMLLSIGLQFSKEIYPWPFFEKWYLNKIWETSAVFDKRGGEVKLLKGLYIPLTNQIWRFWKGRRHIHMKAMFPIYSQYHSDPQTDFDFQPFLHC